MRGPSTAEHSISATYALGLVELAARWEVTPEELLAGTGLTAAALADPSARLSLATFLGLLERARSLTGEAGLGICLGLQMRLSVHGYVGLAAMMTGTLRETLALIERFAPTRTTALSVRLAVEGETAALVFEEHADFGSVRDVLVFALVGGIWQAGRVITGKELGGSANFSFEEPPYFRRFASQLPAQIRFGAPVSEIVFPAGELDKPLPMADPAALRLMEEQCRRELEALGSRDRVAAKARDLIFDEGDSVRTIEETARKLAMSSRTLKRRLGDQGLTYSQIVEEARRERAMRLLRQDDIAIEEVARRLGYTDPANFTRAFRRWTGVSPRAWRSGT